MTGNDCSWSLAEKTEQASAPQIGQPPPRRIRDCWSPPVQIELPLGGDDESYRWKLTKDERKVFQILVMLVSTPYLCALLLTVGPPTVRLLLALLHTAFE